MSHGLTNNDSMFSVREMPWHGLGVVLDQYPSSIDEALDKAGLGWKVTHGDVLVVKQPEWIDDFGTTRPAELIPARGFKANLREDTGEALGIVPNGYEVVDNRDAFLFLEALIGSELDYETARSLWGGRRVWCLARLPEYVELGGDLSGEPTSTWQTATTDRWQSPRPSHRSGSCAPIRSGPRCVMASTGWARSGPCFRHTGNLQTKFAEARQVLGMTINHEKQFKALADGLALEPIGAPALEHLVLRHL